MPSTEPRVLISNPNWHLPLTAFWLRKSGDQARRNLVGERTIRELGEHLTAEEEFANRQSAALGVGAVREPPEPI